MLSGAYYHTCINAVLMTIPMKLQLKLHIDIGFSSIASHYVISVLNICQMYIQSCLLDVNMQFSAHPHISKL